MIFRREIVGEMLCQLKDGSGEIKVIDHNGVRSLYFANNVMQSSINIGQPELLLMDYSQAMMASLLFEEHPEKILLIGLGGGALVHFLLNAFPDAAIDVVEISESVICLAYEYFNLPAALPNLTIFHEAGQDFAARRCQSGCMYDLILVDAFDGSGPAVFLREEGFLLNCQEMLDTNGVLSANIWDRPQDKFPSIHEKFHKVFSGNTMIIRLGEGYNNAVILAFRDILEKRDLAAYRPAAIRLQQRLKINFLKLLRYLYCQNIRGLVDTATE